MILKKRKKKNKYSAVRTKVDDISFASRAEARRFRELKFLSQNGSIRNLELQPRFHIEINGIPLFTYVADFKYDLAVKNTWRPIVEDVKGMDTRLSQIKRKAVLAQYGIAVELVRSDRRGKNRTE